MNKLHLPDKTKNFCIIKYLLLLIVIPLVIFYGVKAFGGKQYAFISVVVLIAACIPFFISFEKKGNVERMIMLAVLTALSVFGRYCFTFVPHFKPVTAIVIITGIYMGGEFGFLCGALSALLSNFIFGQGPWTPFQMFAWGLTGLFAGMLGKYLKEFVALLALYGCLCGMSYSLIMDIWTTMWQDGTFNVARYLTYITIAVPTTVTYMISNIIFLVVLTKPIGKKIERIKTKFGV